MAAPHGVAVPKDNSDMAVLNSLSGLHGKAFDTAYIKQVGLDGHEKAVAAFQTEADGGQNIERLVHPRPVGHLQRREAAYRSRPGRRRARNSRQPLRRTWRKPTGRLNALIRRWRQQASN